MDPRRKLQVVSAANPSLRVTAAPKQLSIAPAPAINTQLRVANNSPQQQVKINVPKAPPVSQYEFASFGKTGERNKTIFGKNAAWLLPKSLEKRDIYGNTGKFTGTQNDFLTQFDKQSDEYKKYYVKNITDRAQQGDQAAINAYATLRDSGRFKGGVMDFVEGFNEKLAGGVLREGLRLGGLITSNPITDNPITRAIPGWNKKVEFERNMRRSLENQANIWDTSDLHYTQAGKYGKTAGTVAKGAADVALLVTGSSAAEKAATKIPAFKSVITAAPDASKLVRFGKYYTSQLPGNFAGTAIDMAQTKGRGDEINYAQSIGVSTVADIVAPSIFKGVGKLWRGARGAIDPAYKATAKYLAKETDVAAIKSILGAQLDVPVENLDNVASYIATETNQKAIDKLVKELSLDPNLQLTDDIRKQLQDNGIQEIRRDPNAQYDAQYSNNTITARGQTELDKNVYHELGHHIYTTKMTPEEQALFKGTGGASKQAVGRTGYTQTDINSEDFSAYLDKAMRGNIDEVPEKYQAVIRKYAGIAEDIAATDNVPIGTKINTSTPTPTNASKVPVGNFDIAGGGNLNDIMIAVKTKENASDLINSLIEEIDTLTKSGDQSLKTSTRINDLKATIKNLSEAEKVLPSETVITNQGVDQVTVDQVTVDQAGKQLSGVAPQQIDGAAQAVETPATTGTAPLAADATTDATKVTEQVSQAASQPVRYNVTNQQGKIITNDGRTADDLIAQAQQQRQQFVDDVVAIAQANGGEVTEKAIKNAVKVNVERIETKIADKSGRAPTDILRSTILTPNPNGTIDGILKSFEDRGYTVWINKGTPDLTNRYTDGTTGYKDIAVKFVKGADDPIVKELQIMTPNMAKAKNEWGGHKLYEQVRAKVGDWEQAEITMNELYQAADALDAAALNSSSVTSLPSSALPSANGAPSNVYPATSSPSSTTLTGTPSTMKNRGSGLLSDSIGDPLSNPSIADNAGNVKNISERGFARSLSQTDTPPEVYENLLGYQSRPNTQTFDQAAQAINQNEQGVLQNVLSKPQGALTDDETAQALLLLDKAIKNDQLDLAEQIAGKINVSGTENGRAVQILAAVRKTTPEGAYLEAQKIITEAQQKGLLPKDFTLPKETVDNIQNQAQYIQDLKAYNTDLERYVSGLDPNSAAYADAARELAWGTREYELSVAVLGKTLKDIVPPTVGDKLNSIVNISLLLNPKTFIRNVIGNAANATGEALSSTISSPLDMLASLKTGKRTTTLPNVLKRLGGFGRGLKEGAQETELGVRIGGGGKYDINPAVFKSKVMSRIEKTLGHSLSDMDKAFSTAQFDETLDSLMRANNVTKPTQEMLDIAEQEALYATFQHDSFIAGSLQEFKGWLNKKANIKGFGLGDIVVRYPKTPGNIVAVGMDYSPYGFLKGLTQFVKLNEKSGLAAQREAVRNLGRGITGTGLIAGGYYLAQNNIITARKDSDKDVNSLQRNQGQPPFSFNFSALGRLIRGEDTKPRPGDVMANYDWLQPNAIQLTMGANMALNKDAGNKDWISSTLDQAAMGLETIEEQPVLAQTGRFFQIVTTPADRGGGIPNAIKDSVVGLPSMFVPSVLNQTAASIDNQARTSYDPNPLKQATNKVVAKLPFASKSLEPVVDSFGNEVKRQQTDNPVTRIFNNFVNPAFVTKLKQTPEGQMVLDLYNKTGEKGQFPRVTDRKMQINGESYSLSAKQITEFQKYTGKETEKAFADLANNPGFMNQSDEEKIKIMSGIVTDIASAARIKILGNEPKTMTNDVKAILGGKTAGFQSKIPDGVNDIAKKYYEKTTFMDQETYDGWLKGEPDQIATEVAGDLNKRRPANTKELPAYNGLAKRYAEYEKAKAEAKKDGSWTKLDEKEKEQEFWKGAIKDSRDDLTKDIYDAGSSGSKDYWEQGLISKEDIDKAIALDDELYASGLSKSLKFSKTFRRSYGYGIPTAPGEKASGSGGSGGGGGRASKKTGVNELKLRYTPDAAPTVSRVPRNVQLKLNKPAPVQVTPVRIRL